MVLSNEGENATMPQNIPTKSRKRSITVETQQEFEQQQGKRVDDNSSEDTKTKSPAVQRGNNASESSSNPSSSSSSNNHNTNTTAQQRRPPQQWKFKVHSIQDIQYPSNCRKSRRNSAPSLSLMNNMVSHWKVDPRIPPLTSAGTTTTTTTTTATATATATTPTTTKASPSSSSSEQTHKTQSNQDPQKKNPRFSLPPSTHTQSHFSPPPPITSSSSSSTTTQYPPVFNTQNNLSMRQMNENNYKSSNSNSMNFIQSANGSSKDDASEILVGLNGLNHFNPTPPFNHPNHANNLESINPRNHFSHLNNGVGMRRFSLPEVEVGGVFSGGVNGMEGRMKKVHLAPIAENSTWSNDNQSHENSLNTFIQSHPLYTNLDDNTSLSSVESDDKDRYRSYAQEKRSLTDFSFPLFPNHHITTSPHFRPPPPPPTNSALPSLTSYLNRPTNNNNNIADYDSNEPSLYSLLPAVEQALKEKEKEELLQSYQSSSEETVYPYPDENSSYPENFSKAAKYVYTTNVENTIHKQPEPILKMSISNLIA